MRMRRKNALTLAKAARCAALGAISVAKSAHTKLGKENTFTGKHLGYIGQDIRRAIHPKGRAEMKREHLSADAQAPANSRGQSLDLRGKIDLSLLNSVKKRLLSLFVSREQKHPSLTVVKRKRKAAAKSAEKINAAHPIALEHRRAEKQL